ncbi:hypothetical protein [Streptomyces sp. NPDC127038]|uniref:hypothetical protein n=1 Tax=Streptomyces sp. NPDC127038 TaxID=3347114 RepID=UPI003651E87D
MITLHEVYEQGSDAVKAAVRSFGSRHPVAGAAPDAEPDWKKAERHFTHLIEVIMGTTAPPLTGAADIVRWAEREAVGFLLAVDNPAGYRCPICVKQQRPQQ